MRNYLFILVCCIPILINAEDSTYLKVHFLYGSKPKKEFRDSEQKWFGGILGGHVGIELEEGRIVNFLPSGKFHLIARKNQRHSRYSIHSSNAFYSMFGTRGDSVKRAIVYIPISQEQKKLFDSISTAYLKETPYDYAFIGMRCGSAAYEILAQLDILPSYGHKRTYRKIFYPKKLRKRLYKKAVENGWRITREDGTVRRKWEQD